ncbi:hypothetical protein MY1884_000585 [Beauveria asiatica]
MGSSAYEDRRKSQNREAQRCYRQKMRKKKRGGGPGSIGNDNDCSSIFDTQLPGLEHVPFNTNPGEYHAASGAGPPGCGDALNIDYQSYHRPSHSRASLASSGIVGINFGGSSWTHPPGMSSVNSPAPPSVEITPSPASPDQSSISIPASLAESRIQRVIFALTAGSRGRNGPRQFGTKQDGI